MHGQQNIKLLMCLTLHKASIKTYVLQVHRLMKHVNNLCQIISILNLVQTDQLYGTKDGLTDFLKGICN